MTNPNEGERRHLLALAVLAVAAVSLAGSPVAFAQVEEPVPGDDPHPPDVAQQEVPSAELGKDEVPTTTVVVGEDEGGLIQAYTIEFGDEKDWVRLASGEWLRGNIERMRDGSMEFKGWRGSDEFCGFYPFHPYQFDLFQKAIVRLSEHDAFTGRHTAVGERSMLSVFQEVAKKLINQNIGALAPFDLMFDGIAATIRRSSAL